MSSPISGFTAIPNPQMLAFMPIQSYLMMYFAGAGWQIGKRKVSAIPNEKFNPMSAKELLQGFSADLRDSIPVLERSLQDITPLIRVLIEQYGDFVREALAATPAAIGNVFGFQSQQGSVRIPEEEKKIVAPKGTQFGFLGYSQIQMEQLIRQHEARVSGSQQDIRDKSQVLTPTQRSQAKFDPAFFKKVQSERGTASRDVMTQGVAQVAKRDIQRQKAGQSQKLERVLLLQKISQMNQLIRDDPAGEKVRFFRQRLANMMQKLRNLQERYRF